MDGKLPLDSPRWRSLKSTSGNAEDIPELIRSVGSEKAFGPKTAFARLVDKIVHQFSCAEATYATVPYLVEIGQEVSPEKALELWHWIGTIATTHDIARDPAPADLLPAFRSAISSAESHCLATLLARQWGLEDTYDLGVDAFGMAGHPLGKLVMDNLVPYDEAESAAVCPKCGKDVEVAVFDTGLVVLKRGSASRPHPPKSEKLPAPPGRFTIPNRSPNPWAPVGQELSETIRRGSLIPGSLPHLEAAATAAEGGVTPDLAAGAAFSLLGALITMKGHPQPAMRYFHANDTVVCPNCGQSFAFADHWWGLKRD